MKISDLLTPALIQLELVSQDKDELFEEMVSLLAANGLIADRAAAVRVLQEREEKMSTGVGNGIGIPHGKLPGARQALLALGISHAGIDYDALDGEPVHIVLVIFAQPDNPGQHIELLAEISRLFSIPGFSDRLMAAATPQEALEIIKSEE